MKKRQYITNVDILLAEGKRICQYNFRPRIQNCSCYLYDKTYER